MLSPPRGSRASDTVARVLASTALLVATATMAQAQTPTFTDVTPAVMLDPGAWGEGVASGDFDNDGDLDLCVGSEGQRLVIYRNDGTGTFTSFKDFGLGNWTGVAWADYDNDGDIDLFAAEATTPKHLFRNDGGVFVDVTAGDLIDTSHAHSVAWGDVDLDGDVDLFYAVAFPPTQPPGGGNRLFRNDGGDVFVDITPPVMDDPQYGRGCSFGDYDNDGDPDIFVANFGTSRLYRNDAGVFVDVTAPPLSEYGHGGGVAWGDADNDGDLDLAIAKAYSSASRVYRNDGGGVFTDVTPPGGAIADTAIAIAWADVDLDADLDLFIGAYKGTRLLRNDGGFAFTDITPSVLGDDIDPLGVAWFDFDNDGDLDVFYATYWGKTDHLFRNDTPTSRHWLQVSLVGRQSNRSGIGARVEVVTGSLRQTRAIVSGEGYNASNSLRAHFGLAGAEVADSIVIRWPSGIVQHQVGVLADRVLTIVERDATTAVDGPSVSAWRLRIQPNPSGEAATLTFAIPSRAGARVTIADLQGRRVRSLFDGVLEAGTHAVAWDGRDDAGRAVAPGVYVASLDGPVAGARARIVRF